MDLRSLRYFVAVAEELHFGRAAARLHMTQPPLSRTIRELEADLGVLLIKRGAGVPGVSLTAPGAALLIEAGQLLAGADRLREAVQAAAGEQTFTVGTLGDGAGELGPSLVAAFRARHPNLQIRTRVTGLADPSAGLRARLVDAAVTRLPFDTDGIAWRLLRTDPLVAVLPAQDPLAASGPIDLAQLASRRWFRLPHDADPAWRDFWRGSADGPVVHTVEECLQAVVWDGAVGVLPAPTASRQTPEGVAFVPLRDLLTSRLIVAWPKDVKDPVTKSFVNSCVTTARRHLPHK